MKALVGEAIGEARKANERLQKIADQNPLIEQQKRLITRSKAGDGYPSLHAR